MAKRYKGRYVAQVEIDFDIDAELPGILPFETIQNGLCKCITPAIKDVIKDKVVDKWGTVTVTQQYADLWEVEEDG